MSRSYKKTPICGYTKATSDKEGKKQINKRLRKEEKRNLKYSVVNNILDNFNSTHRDFISKYSYLPKDGKQFVFIDNNIDDYRKTLKK